MTKNEAHIENLLAQMTLVEKVALLSGASSWHTNPIERLNIPAIKVSDGPNGARGGGALVGGLKAACFPVAISLASTWHTDLIEQIGVALAEEVTSKGAQVLLAPTVNIHRSTLNGRNFECYSEDPFLSARLAVAYINGVQSQGVAATIKHFVGNESEYQRTTMSSEIEERSLREIYLPPFEAAIKQANVRAVMSSYNRVNGTFAGEHPELLNNILKEEWGFDGIVMSDWFAAHSIGSIEDGLDLEMPGPARERGAKLVQAVENGQVSEAAVTEGTRRVLRLIDWVGAFANPALPEERAEDRPAHRALIRQAGAEGTVLLKNDGLLPLSPDRPRKIAIIGPNAQTAQIMGGGSARVNAHYRVSPYDGLQAQAGDDVTVDYAIGCTNYRYLPLLEYVFTADYFNNVELLGEIVHQGDITNSEIMWYGPASPLLDTAFSVRLTTQFTPDAAGDHEFGLISSGPSRMLLNGKLLIDNWTAWQIGTPYFGYASDEARQIISLRAGQTYSLTVEYAYLAPEEGFPVLRFGVDRPLGAEAIAEAVTLASASDEVILCVGLNGEWDTEGSDRPHMDLVGRQNELIEAVAQANPRTVVVLQTGGPVTMPWLDQVGAVVQAWYPGQECGNTIADVLFGAVNPAGRLPQTFPKRLADNPAYLNYPGENGRVRYGEGIFVGYRYYDHKLIEPLFPFGFGLSYTTFSYANIRLSAEIMTADGTLTLSVDVTNTGERDGQEVVQLYLRDVESRLVRPPKELKGFAKVALAAGETRTVRFTIDHSALAYWDDAQNGWVVEPGQFEALVGRSAAEIEGRKAFTIYD